MISKIGPYGVLFNDLSNQFNTTEDLFNEGRRKVSNAAGAIKGLFGY